MLFHHIGDLTQEFNFNQFALSKTFNVILMGQQLRRIPDLLKINSPLIGDKIWLSGIKSLADRDRVLKLEIESQNLGEKHFFLFKEIVKTPYLGSHSDYDKLIQTSILVMPLYDAAANNSILECITSNTPIFVTRCAGAEEYLGSKYPLFFDSIDQLNSLLSNRDKLIGLVGIGYEYVKKLDKTHLSYKRFYSDLIKVINDIYI